MEYGGSKKENMPDTDTMEQKASGSIVLKKNFSF